MNTLGNCASRVTAMVGKYFDGACPSERDASGAVVPITAAAQPVDWPRRASEASATALAAYDALDLSTAARTAVRLVTDVDVYIQATEPFKLAKDSAKTAELGAILYQCMEAVRVAGALLSPIMPDKCAELAAALGDDVAVPLATRVQWGRLKTGTQLPKLALFPRVESPDAPAPPPPPPPKPAKKQKAPKPAPGGA